MKIIAIKPVAAPRGNDDPKPPEQVKNDLAASLFGQHGQGPLKKSLRCA